MRNFFKKTSFNFKDGKVNLKVGDKKEEKTKKYYVPQEQKEALQEVKEEQNQLIKTKQMENNTLKEQPPTQRPSLIGFTKDLEEALFKSREVSLAVINKLQDVSPFEYELEENKSQEPSNLVEHCYSLLADLETNNKRLQQIEKHLKTIV